MGLTTVQRDCAACDSILQLTHHVPDRTSHLWKLMAHVSCNGRHVHAPVQRVQPLWVNCRDVYPEVVLQVVPSKQS